MSWSKIQETVKQIALKLTFQIKFKSSEVEKGPQMSLIAGQVGTGDPPSGLSAFKTVGSQLAVSAGKKMFKIINKYVVYFSTNNDNSV